MTVSEEEACAALSDAIAEIATDVENGGLAGDVCGGFGETSGGDGSVGWAIRKAEAAASDQYEVEWVSARASRLDGMVAIVVFNSGID